MAIYILVLEKCSVQNPPQGYFGGQFSSDSTILSSNTFEVSNIYNCHIIEVYCLNAYLKFAAF